MKQLHTAGMVYFIGAGPGDPELLTLKGARILAQADVVLYDRLVSPEILKLVNINAQQIQTGKQKNGNSIKQVDINNLIIQYALQGKTVARLKGGDVSFFSNILDELLAITQNNIVYEIIPGVTAASGCAAYAGIPLTARGYSHSVRILTLHQVNLFGKNDWKELATSSDTLVFYMSSSNLNFMIDCLIVEGASADLPMVVIEQGTTPYQKEYFSCLGSAKQDFKGLTFVSPALVIMGKVVTLANKFKWYKANEVGVYFKELQSV